MSEEMSKPPIIIESRCGLMQESRQLSRRGLMLRKIRESQQQHRHHDNHNHNNKRSSSRLHRSKSSESIIIIKKKKVSSNLIRSKSAASLNRSKSSSESAQQKTKCSTKQQRLRRCNSCSDSKTFQRRPKESSLPRRVHSLGKIRRRKSFLDDKSVSLDHKSVLSGGHHPSRRSDPDPGQLEPPPELGCDHALQATNLEYKDATPATEDEGHANVTPDLGYGDDATSPASGSQHVASKSRTRSTSRRRRPSWTAMFSTKSSSKDPLEDVPHRKARLGNDNNATPNTDDLGYEDLCDETASQASSSSKGVEAKSHTPSTKSRRQRRSSLSALFTKSSSKEELEQPDHVEDRPSRKRRQQRRRSSLGSIFMSTTPDHGNDPGQFLEDQVGKGRTRSRRSSVTRRASLSTIFGVGSTDTSFDKGCLDPDMDFFSLINGDTPYDDETVRQYIKRHPDAVCAKYPFQVRGRGQDQHRYPLATLMGLGASLEVIQLAVKACPEACLAQGHFRATALHAACFGATNLQVVKYIYKARPQAIQETTQHVFLPLHNACQRDGDDDNDVSLEIIQFLVEKYPEGLVKINKLGDTPLRTAQRIKGMSQHILDYLEQETKNMFDQSCSTSYKKEIEQRQSWGRSVELGQIISRKEHYESSSGGYDATTSEESSSSSFDPYPSSSSSPFATPGAA